MSKIQRIFIKNIKAITEQELVLGGCSALITAGNNKGKTTLLTALPNRLMSKRPGQVVKKNETEGRAEIELTTGEKFIWEVTEDKEKLTFITSEGLKKPCVKEISRRYFSEPFDMDKFLAEGPKEQAKILQKLVGIDFEDLDKEYKKAYEERTFLKRRLSETESQELKYDDRIPIEKIDIALLQKQYTDGITHNSIMADKQIRIRQAAGKIDELRNQAILKQHEIEQLQAELDSMPPAIDVNQLKGEIEVAINKNQYIEKNIKAKDHHNVIEKQRADVAKAEEQVTKIEQQKIERLKSVNLPEGVTITDDGLKVDGLELSKQQLSLSKIYITALKISALALGEVRMRFFDAAPLDKNSLLEIEEWALANDLQLLIEKPDFDGGEIKYEIINETT